MTPSLSRAEAVAVLDVGKADVKLLAISPQGQVLSVRSAPNAVRRGQPYPSCDTDHLWRWMMAALADLGERFALQAIVPTSYGSTAALIDAAALVLPILDYATDPPPEIAAAYVESAPWFEECYCPVNPASVTLGRQLFWLSREFPDAFERARWILPFAQYWAWGLAGVPACEVTSLGAQTQLWDPRERALSSLVWRQGWADKFPPLRNAWDVLGPLQLELARKCDLPDDLPVMCGIYASGANIARYLAAGLDDFTLISSGEWLVVYQPHLPLHQLAPLRATAVNVDLLGSPVACARFMAGREYTAIAGADGGDDRAEMADVETLVAAGTMALPSFTTSGGPFPGTGGPCQPVSRPDDERVPGSATLAHRGGHRRRVGRRPAVHGSARGAAARAAGRGFERASRRGTRRSAAVGLVRAHGAGAPRSQPGGGGPNRRPVRLRAPLA